MECFNCKVTDDLIEQFYVEKFDCPHCNIELEMKFFLCLQCGAVWKMINNNMLSGIVFDTSELEFMTGTNINDLVSMLVEDKMFKGENAQEMDMKDYFANYVVDCVRCNQKAYKISENIYKCSCCDFEWEVVSFG